MSLDKSINSKKDRRKPYYKSGRNDRTCRNHGSCPYCKNNRLFHAEKALEKASETEQVNEYFGYWGYVDPSAVTEDVYNERLAMIGVDPWDFETLDELGV